MTASVLPGLALLPSALAVFLIVLSRGRPAIRETWSVAAAVAQTGVVAAMVPSALAGAALTWSPLAMAEGSPFVLRADPLGVLFAALASSLWVVTTVYSIGYTRALAERAQTRYFACFALALFSTVGVALAGNLLTFFGFFELLTVVTYPLVVHKGTPEAAQAGRVYLGYTLTAGRRSWPPQPARKPSRGARTSCPAASLRVPLRPPPHCGGSSCSSSSGAASRPPSCRSTRGCRSRWSRPLP